MNEQRTVIRTGTVVTALKVTEKTYSDQSKGQVQWHHVRFDGFPVGSPTLLCGRVLLNSKHEAKSPVKIGDKVNVYCEPYTDKQGAPKLGGVLAIKTEPMFTDGDALALYKQWVEEDVAQEQLAINLASQPTAPVQDVVNPPITQAQPQPQVQPQVQVQQPVPQAQPIVQQVPPVIPQG